MAVSILASRPDFQVAMVASSASSFAATKLVAVDRLVGRVRQIVDRGADGDADSRADHLPAHRLHHRAGDRPLLGEGKPRAERGGDAARQLPEALRQHAVDRGAKRQRADRAAGRRGAEARRRRQRRDPPSDRSAPSISARPNRA